MNRIHANKLIIHILIHIKRIYSCFLSPDYYRDIISTGHSKPLQTMQFLYSELAQSPSVVYAVFAVVLTR